MDVSPIPNPIQMQYGGSIPQGPAQQLNPAPPPEVIGLHLGAPPHEMSLREKLHLYEPVNPGGDRTVTTTVDDITVKIVVNRVVGAATSSAKTPLQDSSTLVIHEIVTTTHDSLNGNTQTTTRASFGGDDATKDATADQIAALVKNDETSAASFSVDTTDERSVSTAVYSTDLQGVQHIALASSPEVEIDAKPVVGLLATNSTKGVVADAASLANQLAGKYATLDQFENEKLIQTQVQSAVNA